MTKVFKVQETTTSGEFMVIFDTFAVNVPPISSSYNVVAARLLGFTYPDYLRYCKSKGADLRGKQGYTRAIWKTKTAAENFAKTLNKIWEDANV